MDGGRGQLVDLAAIFVEDAGEARVAHGGDGEQGLMEIGDDQSRDRDFGVER